MGVAAAEGAPPPPPHPRAAWYINVLCTWTLSLLAFTGRIRDLFWTRPKTRKGFAEISDPHQDFYNRRLYGRIHDCWNRPIASAPGAWIDVMEREDIAGSYKSTRKLAFTGRRQRCLNLGSYNYLGFAAADEYCTPRVLSTMEAWGISTCSSRAEGGTTPLHAELEGLVAEFLGTEDAITYGMGFATNSASIPALCGPGTLVLSDALNHTSIVAGVKASGASVKVFRHNNVRHLESLLRFHIAEGQPRTHRPWKKVRLRAWGCMRAARGAAGAGLCEQAGVDPRDVDVLMGTFTKSFGSAGGYVAGSKRLVAYLRRHSPAHLYAASIAPGAAQQIISALKLIRGDDGSGRGAAKVAQLHDNANYFRRKLLEMGLHVLGDWDSPVMPIMVYHIGLLASLSRRLLSRRVAMVVVGFPATPLLLCRCRVCISAAHSREDLDYALDALRDLVAASGIDFANRSGGGLRGLLARLTGRAPPRGWRAPAGGAAALAAELSAPCGGCGEGACGGLGSRRASSDGSSCSGSAVVSGGSSSIADSSSCGASADISRPGSAADSWAALAPSAAKSV
ncbi:hypothetical protein Rsub_10398 [Raphidocelis subcapitata]|uniref:serine C-palmitoyltransferase n=1 Tax=Raphidocelis subcapitata TaxID=307507 RepID=A0A2V0PKB4_9CHLO|nr:hypothetical protein Rsub_10398 [Raphidocelis subcapitata]|eukprot:GBF97475.1 hypothetical protein Rsub_10398 [Raphidocelis subcapitata]